MQASSLWVSLTETLSNELGKDIISGGPATTLFVFIPDNSGCYVLTSFDGNVLYVGLTKNLKRGMAQHLDNREKVNPTSNGSGSVVFLARVRRSEQGGAKVEHPRPTSLCAADTQQDLFCYVLMK